MEIKSGTKRLNEIDTNNFQVKENTLWFPDYFLQISNIAQVSTTKYNKEAYPSSVVWMILGGLLCFSGTRLSFVFVLIGLGLWAGAAYTIYSVYQRNQAKEDKRYLKIILNSGNSFYFHCRTKEFADRVMEALRECVNNPHANFTVDFKENQITNSTVVIGNSNEVTV